MNSPPPFQMASPEPAQRPAAFYSAGPYQHSAPAPTAGGGGGFQSGRSSPLRPMTEVPPPLPPPGAAEGGSGVSLPQGGGGVRLPRVAPLSAGSYGPAAGPYLKRPAVGRRPVRAGLYGPALATTTGRLRAAGRSD